MEKVMRHFRATIKEKNGQILHPTYCGYVDKKFLIDFWGLNNGDVESWEIVEEK